MRRLLRLVVFLMAALVVTGVTYVVGSSEWAVDHVQGNLLRGGPAGFERREGFGLQEGQLEESEGLTRPEGDFGRPEGSEGREGGRAGNVFSSASLISFAHTLVPMALVIAVVTLSRKGIGAIRRRTDSAVRT